MALLIFSLLILICILLGFIILIQNPKGGGLTGSIGGMSNQIMGVKQTNDVMEKGTWLFAGLIGVICVLSTYLLTGSSTSNKSMIDRVNTSAPIQQTPAAPGGTAPFQAPANPAPAPPAN